jgi:hypothetical protein
MTLVLLWILRIIVILFVLRLILRALFPQRIGAGKGGAAKRQERVGGALVRDPHCGTYIPKARAIVVGSGAGALHFCSVACRDAYAKPAAGARAS